MTKDNQPPTNVDLIDELNEIGPGAVGTIYWHPLLRARDALERADRELAEARLRYVYIEDDHEECAREATRLRHRLSDQAAVLQSIRDAAGQKDWLWVYDALAHTHDTSTEC